MFDCWQNSGVEDSLLHLHGGAQQNQQQHDRGHMAESGAPVVTFAEAEASRKNIQEYLKHHCAYELLPESGKVRIPSYLYLVYCAPVVHLQIRDPFELFS